VIGIDIYGRDTCDVCNRFKKRVSDMGFKYNSHNIDEKINHHEGWKTDGSIEVLAAMHCINDSHLPVAKIDGKFMNFSSSINFLKGVKDEQNKKGNTK
jgi:hypothetical protein